MAAKAVSSRPQRGVATPAGFDRSVREDFAAFTDGVPLARWARAAMLQTANNWTRIDPCVARVSGPIAVDEAAHIASSRAGQAVAEGSQ